MTGPVITPLAVPSAAARAKIPIQIAGRRVLPLPTLPAPRTNDVVYGLSRLDCRGRIADRAVVAALGWRPGTLLGVEHLWHMHEFDDRIPLGRHREWENAFGLPRWIPVPPLGPVLKAR
ncbi:hypothetical protein GCM10017566_05300 [Amycolatopsis bartoniae]|uniref:Uncharacterized protein n=1 Tax=Amycolatopsis bartoniae TaxID=941986 RepID=A0A8H9M323_9PSEU|nr:hypothetical protein GCM10017566_05300 [Amycolatopsis bartoniae]